MGYHHVRARWHLDAAAEDLVDKRRLRRAQHQRICERELAAVQRELCRALVHPDHSVDLRAVRGSLVKQIARKARDGQIDPETIDVDTLSAHVSLPDICDPDLFIRTGGEKRISNYLLWHLAYTELYFTDVLWPDFSDVELGHALEFYAGRQRRFGRTGEQVQDTNA